ncbi:hypothetical protein V1264_002639 [Littorina saxatilis]
MTSAFANQVILKVYEEEIRTSTHLGIQLFCDIERPHGSSLHCSTVSWTRSDVPDEEDDDDTGNDVNGRDSGHDETKEEDLTTETYTVRAKVSVHMFAELRKNASREESFHAEEHLKGRYSCSVTCGSRDHTVTCAVIRFKHKNRTFLCAEKSFSNVDTEKLHSENHQENNHNDDRNNDDNESDTNNNNKNNDDEDNDDFGSTTPNANDKNHNLNVAKIPNLSNDDGNDDDIGSTTQTANDKKHNLNIERITNLKPSSDDGKEVVLPGTAPRVVAGLTIIVSCFLCISTVVFYRCYAKYRTKPLKSWNRSAGNCAPLPGALQRETSLNSEEQQQREQELPQRGPGLELRQHSRQQRRQDISLHEEHRRHRQQQLMPNVQGPGQNTDLLSFASFSRLLTRSQRLSSPSSSHHNRSPIFLGDSRMIRTGQRSLRNASGRRRYDLLQQHNTGPDLSGRRYDSLRNTGVGGSGGAAWGPDSDDTVVIFMPCVAEMTGAKLPSYDDAMAEARQEGRDRVSGFHPQHNDDQCPGLGENRHLLTESDSGEEEEEEEEEYSSCASSGSRPSSGHLGLPMLPPPYQTSEASHEDISGGVSLVDSNGDSSASSDDLVNTSRPPSYHSLDTEVGERAAMQSFPEQS